MKMLRQWNGDSLKPILEIFEKFSYSISKPKLLKYECITPDSFVWVLDTEKGRFCIFAEDFIPSLEHISKAMRKYGVLDDEKDEYELVKVKEPEEWDNSSPVLVSDTYTPPKNTDEFMNHAVSSGYDFVFLGYSLNN